MLVVLQDKLEQSTGLNGFSGEKTTLLQLSRTRLCHVHTTREQETLAPEAHAPGTYTHPT